MPHPPRDPLGLAFAAESRMAARLEAFAAKAAQEGRPDLAGLFSALSLSHHARAKRYLMLLRGKIGGTAENLDGLRTEELPALMAELAELEQALEDQGNHPGANALGQALKVGAEAAKRLEEAAAGPGEPRPWRVCQVCGYLTDGEPPEHCPVCGAVAARFTRVT